MLSLQSVINTAKILEEHGYNVIQIISIVLIKR